MIAICQEVAPGNTVLPRGVAFNPADANLFLDLVGSSYTVLPNIYHDLPVGFPEFAFEPRASGFLFDLFAVTVCRACKGLPDSQHLASPPNHRVAFCQCQHTAFHRSRVDEAAERAARLDVAWDE